MYIEHLLKFYVHIYIFKSLLNYDSIKKSLIYDLFLIFAKISLQGVSDV